MMKDGVVVVDLCNTICNVNQMLEDVLHVKRKTGEYRMSNLPENVFLNNPEIFLLPRVFDYAAESLQLISQNYSIVYVTARPESARDVSKKYLISNGFPGGEIIFSTQKVKVCKDMGNVVCAFEDEPDTIRSYIDAGIPVFSKIWDYNVNLGINFQWNDLYTDLLKAIP